MHSSEDNSVFYQHKDTVSTLKNISPKIILKTGTILKWFKISPKKGHLWVLLPLLYLLVLPDLSQLPCKEILETLELLEFGNTERNAARCVPTALQINTRNTKIEMLLYLSQLP